jgi:hypothetical protein
MMLHEVLIESDFPQLLNSMKEVGLSPVMAREPMARLLEPVFFKVITWATLVAPTSVAGNVALLEDRVATGAPAIVTLTVLDVEASNPVLPE